MPAIEIASLLCRRRWYSHAGLHHGVRDPRLRQGLWLLRPGKIDIPVTTEVVTMVAMASLMMMRPSIIPSVQALRKNNVAASAQEEQCGCKRFRAFVYALRGEQCVITYCKKNDGTN
jgi:hypothetical protein